MKQRTVSPLVLFILFGLPTVAMANAGTPLMRAAVAHLIVGNAIIGLLEGALLSRLFRVSAPRAIVLMVLANYFSAFVGVLWLAELPDSQIHIDLYNAHRVFLATTLGRLHRHALARVAVRDGMPLGNKRLVSS